MTGGVSPDPALRNQSGQVQAGPFLAHGLAKAATDRLESRLDHMMRVFSTDLEVQGGAQ